MSGEETRAPRTRRREGPGIATALLGMLFLIVLGFALGVVAGLVMEEPELVMDYAAGRTTSVPLDPGRSRPETPAAQEPGASEDSGSSDPGADSPAGRATQSRGDGTAGAGAVRPAAPEVAAAPPASAGSDAPARRGFAIQVGAFGDADSAHTLVKRLRAAGHPVYVSPAADSGAARWRVRVGPLETRVEAEKLAEKLKQDERLPTWVLAESPSDS